MILFILPLFWSLQALLPIRAELLISQDYATKVVDSTFFVSCYESENKTLPVRWIGPKGEIGFNSRGPKLQRGSAGTSIFFQQTLPEDAGKYTCVSHAQKKDFYLNVVAPLEFLDTPLEQRGVEGEDVTVRCEVRGGRMAWTYDDDSKINDTRIQILGDGLLISKANRDDSKVYVCKAIQESTGKLLDRKIKLIIEYPPSFQNPETLSHETIFAFPNSFVNLTLEVDAEPPVKFNWLATKSQKKGTVKETINKSYLELKMEPSSYGNYKCVAANRWGKVEKKFIIQEGVKPDPPDFIELRGVNHDLFDIGIHGPYSNMTESMKTTGYNVKFKEHTTDLEDWREEDFQLSFVNSYPLRNLEKDTEYEVMAATRNAAGLSEYTNISIFKTLKSDGRRIHKDLSFGYVIFTACFVVFLSNFRVVRIRFGSSDSQE